MPRKMTTLVFVLLLIEFLDEFVFGTREAAMPLIRTDLGLSYTQIGLLITLPAAFAGMVEPIFGILGDTWNRRVLVLGGGIGFAISALLFGLSTNYTMLLIVELAFFPASGAFVSLSQATLMDSDPTRHDQNMARWTFAGSVGVVVSPLILSAALLIGAGWRELFVMLGGLSILVLLLAWRLPFPTPQADEDEEPLTFRDGLRNAWVALKRREVLRWLVLLQFSDLMLDVLLGFLALYLVDVVGLTVQQAAFGVVVWTSVGLLGDLLLIPLLEKVEGLAYLRVSVVVELFLYPAFLLVPGFIPKLIILGLLGFFNAGWYAILSGRLYNEMPGQSGTVLAVSNIIGYLGASFPLVIGLAAETWGLDAAMWLIIAGPIALFIGLPRTATRLTVGALVAESE